MSNRSLGRGIAPSSWLWIGLALSLTASGLYHFGLQIERVLVFLGLLGSLRLVCLKLGRSGLELISRRTSVRILFLLSIALLTITATYELNKSPRLYWRFDTDSDTWRPTTAWPRTAWGEKKKTIALHPMLADKTGSVNRPWCGVARIDGIRPDLPKRIVFYLTQPEAGPAESQIKLIDWRGRSDGVSIRFEGNRDGAWTDLQFLNLDLADRPEQRFWHEVLLDLTSDIREIRVSVEARPRLDDSAGDAVWIGVESMHRADTWYSLNSLMEFNDLVWTALARSGRALF